MIVRVFDIVSGSHRNPMLVCSEPQHLRVDGHKVTVYTIGRGTYHVVFTSLPLEAIIEIKSGDDLEGALDLMHVVQMDHFVPPSGTLPVETIPF